MTLLLEGAIQSSLILILALGVTALLRRRPAALRHAVLALAVACAAVAPIAGRAMPSWQLPFEVPTLSGPEARPAPSSETAPGERLAALSNPARTDGAMTRAVSVLALIWGAGVACAVLFLTAGFLQLAALAARARPAPSRQWKDTLEAIVREYGIARPVSLLLSAHPSIVVTWGLRRPTIVLPAAAVGWADDRVRIVLYHELAHVRRGDWLVMLAAEAVRCVYWFNPLVWMASARLRHESERACDDEVLNRGVEAAAYAEELVGIARDLTRCRLQLPAPAISRSSRFERRVQAMLDTRQNRGPVSRRSFAAAAAVVIACSIAIAAAQSGFASLTGSIVDPSSGVLPGVTLTLTNVATEAKYEVRTDRTGRYEFVGLPPGEYAFEAKNPGFATFKARVVVAGQNLQRDLTLDVGSVQETITVASSRSNPSTAAAAPATPARPKPPLPNCEGTPAVGGLSIGGNIRPPMKLKHVRPLYAPHLAAQGIAGTVVLKGRIGTSGVIEDLEVVSAPHPELAGAARDAVAAWEFSETLLNCNPVAIPIGITVNFTLEP